MAPCATVPCSQTLSIRSSTRHPRVLASDSRLSTAALLMSFARCSYCWILRRETPDFSDSSLCEMPLAFRTVCSVVAAILPPDSVGEHIHCLVFRRFMQGGIHPFNFTHRKNLQNIFKRHTGTPLKISEDISAPIFRRAIVFKSRQRNLRQHFSGTLKNIQDKLGTRQS